MPQGPLLDRRRCCCLSLCGVTGVSECVTSAAGCARWEWLCCKVGTFATSSSYYAYERMRFFSSEELLQIMGFGKICLHGMNATEIAIVMGNSMATPSLVIVLVPVLIAIGALVKGAK